MGYFYFDETIQDRGEFIIGAFIYAKNDLTSSVFKAIKDVGLKPGVDEFKSHSIMSENSKQFELRSSIATILQHSCRLGMIVAPQSQRANLGVEALNCLSKIIRANGLEQEKHVAYFDEGVAFPKHFSFEHKNSCDVFFQEDSKKRAGIQVADFASHYLGSMLLEKMELVTKMVRAGEASGYVPETEFPLGFELWASLRHSFFRGPAKADWDSNDDITAKQTYLVFGYGLHVAESCDEKLTKAALEKFGECYLGCIH